MIKNILYILGIISMVACHSSSKKDIPVVEEVDKKKSIASGDNKVGFDLNGTWGLTNCFDTIVENRELAKYRLQSPTWFAIILDIENDSLSAFGSIASDEYLIEKTSDSIATLTSNITGQQWFLISNDPELHLVQHPNSRKTDSTVYTFRKREDLEYFTQVNKDAFVIGNNVTDYFNEQLFEGQYLNSETGEEIVFAANGQLTGMDGFDSYEVRNYFGTLHMHKNLDVITFKNKDNREYRQYNWVFSDDELNLREFVFEKVTSNGKTYEGEYFVLGTEKIKLKKR